MAVGTVQVWPSSSDRLSTTSISPKSRVSSPSGRARTSSRPEVAEHGRAFGRPTDERAPPVASSPRSAGQEHRRRPSDADRGGASRGTAPGPGRARHVGGDDDVLTARTGGRPVLEPPGIGVATSMWLREPAETACRPAPARDAGTRRRAGEMPGQARSMTRRTIAGSAGSRATRGTPLRPHDTAWRAVQATLPAARATGRTPGRRACGPPRVRFVLSRRPWREEPSL
jgi:hypothetical protein